MNKPLALALLCALPAIAARYTPTVDLSRPADPPDHVLTVHAITHTHDDVGWLETVDGYYESHVRTIITNVVKSLAADPKRLYTYVEIAFFSKWWDEQSEETKATVRQLVNEGRLDFTIGGWCMPDEASTTYTDLIDQMSAGHLWLKKTFGDVAAPKAGWQIDPFGHSSGNTWLYKQFGFDSNVVCRIDRHDINWRRHNSEMEFIWRPFRSFDDTPAEQDLFTTILYDGYCWPGGRHSNASGPYYDTEDFANGIYNVYKSFSTPEIPITLGCDFEWRDAELEFKLLDDLMLYYQTHPEIKINLIYSTPKRYAAAVLKYNKTYNLKKDDFWPYGDSIDDYWSGYFTSHPAFKRSIRASSGLFYSARAVNTLLTGDDSFAKKLEKPWHAMGVVQHHDSITGTSKSFVYDDYLKQLADGDKESIAVLEESLGLFGTPYKFCGLSSSSAENDFSCTEVVTAPEIVGFYNPTAWVRSEMVRLIVKDPAVCVFASDDSSVPLQLRELEQGGYELSFLASDIPALGFNTWKISECQPPFVDIQAQIAESNASIENEFLQFTFVNGELKSAFDKTRGLTIPIQSEVLYYIPENSPKDPRSGAYVFASNKAPQSFPGRRTMKKFSGKLFEEVKITISPTNGLTQSYRLNSGEKFLRMNTAIGPIDVSDNLGKEVVVRLRTGIKTGRHIYTDSNGLEFVRHTYNQISDKWVIDDNPISGNFYPVSLSGYISDGVTTVALLPDRAQGFASLADGTIEAMIHRRLLTDGDHKGVGEALNDQTAILVKHLVFLEPAESAIRAIRVASINHEHPLMGLHAAGAQYDAIRWRPIPHSLPANVHITTMQAQPDEPLLLRLTHIYAAGEDPELSNPVTMSLDSIFTGTWQIVEVHELSLSANKVISRFEDDEWDITLRPMETRTLLVKLHQKC